MFGIYRVEISKRLCWRKTLAADSSILIFDEPTRGIDVGAKQEIYNLMVELVNQGKAIIMISSEMEELLGMSDRSDRSVRRQIYGRHPQGEI